MSTDGDLRRRMEALAGDVHSDVEDRLARTIRAAGRRQWRRRAALGAAGALLVAAAVAVLLTHDSGSTRVVDAPATSIVDRLEGRWSTATVTCREERDAALHAGLTTGQIQRINADLAVCTPEDDGPHTVTFTGSSVVLSRPGGPDLRLPYQIVDDSTAVIQADPTWCCRVVLHYAIDGDSLRIVAPSLEELRAADTEQADAQIVSAAVTITTFFTSAPFVRQT
jgi:hypothetical protein